MKTMKQVLGALSRDMLFLHGHIVSVRGLDGAVRGSTYAAAPKAGPKPRETKTDAPDASGSTPACNAQAC